MKISQDSFRVNLPKTCEDSMTVNVIKFRKDDDVGIRRNVACLRQAYLNKSLSTPDKPSFYNHLVVN